MATLQTYPMQDNYETKLTQSWNGAPGTVYVVATPGFTMPANSYTIVTVDPGTDKEQAFIMDSFNSTAKTLNAYSTTVNKGPGLPYTQQSHSVGAVVRISDSYANWEALANAFNVASSETFIDIDFTGTTTPGLAVKELTTAQVNALSLTKSWIVKDTTTGEFKAQQGGAVVTLSSGSTQPNASTTVAGKVEISTQAETENQTTTGGTGAIVVPTNETINPNNITSATPASGDKISFSDVSDSNKLKSATISTLSTIIQPLLTFVEGLYFGDGSDGDVTLSGVGTTTLTRDMYYNNLTVTSPAILDPNGYRVFIKGTFSGTGTINRDNPNAGSAGGPGSTGGGAGTAGAVLNQGSLNMEVASGNGGTGAYNGTGAPGSAGTAANPSMTNTDGVAGGSGGASGVGQGYAGAAGGASTRGTRYNLLLYPQILHLATASTTFDGLNYKSIGGSGGGGGGGSQGLYYGGGGGGGGGNGGFIWIACKTWSFTGLITATGAAGGPGGAGQSLGSGGGGGGGGGGGNGGIILRIYSTLTADCTKTLTGGAGGAGGAGSGIGLDGNAGSTGATGETISIVI